MHGYAVWNGQAGENGTGTETLSTVVNLRVDQVGLTYCAVFVAGAVLYLSFARVALTPRDLEFGIGRKGAEY